MRVQLCCLCLRNFEANNEVKRGFAYNFSTDKTSEIQKGLRINKKSTSLK